MKLVALILGLMICSLSIGQTVNDFTTAKATALVNNKLIALDFIASWCQPCLKMNSDFWENEKYKETLSNFVILKVDITNNSELRNSYRVTKIPRIIVININEDKLLDEEGYKSPDALLKKFNAFSKDYSKLNQALLPFIDSNSIAPNEFYNLGNEFMKSGLQVEDYSIKSMFLSKAKYYFKKCEKNSELEELKIIAQLSQLRVNSYQGKHKKVISRLSKMQDLEKYKTTSDLSNFILAYCYKKEGKQKEEAEATEKIKDKKLLEEINSLS